ncbi:MAG TPA: hypothetical protein VK663_10855 [Burkholderiales bacterium]|nr:hypothetical protein [Burkholderiales bacterium]
MKPEITHSLRMLARAAFAAKRKYPKNYIGVAHIFMPVVPITNPAHVRADRYLRTVGFADIRIVDEEQRRSIMIGENLLPDSPAAEM